MAKGSDPAVTWVSLPEGTPHECAGCGRKLRIKDICEVRTDYPARFRSRTRVWGNCCPPGHRAR